MSFDITPSFFFFFFIASFISGTRCPRLILYISTWRGKKNPSFFLLCSQLYSQHFASGQQTCVFPTPSSTLIVSRRHLGGLQFNSILTWSSRGQCQIPQKKGSVPQDCPSAFPLHTGRQFRLAPVFLTDYIYIRGLTTPPWIRYLLQWLMGFRETFVFTSLLWRIEFRNSQMEEMLRARCGGGGGAPMTSPGTSVCPPAQKLTKPCNSGIFMAM